MKGRLGQNNTWKLAHTCINMKVIIYILLSSTFLFSGCASLGGRGGDICVKLGQEWSYITRDHESESRATIVDAFINDKRQRFYVVRVTGVKMNNPKFKNYFADEIPYFILSEIGLKASLVSLQGESRWNKFYDHNYQQWRKNLSGQDYLGFTIKEKLETIDEILNIKLGA